MFDQSLLEDLKIASSPSDKAVLVADALLNSLPPEIATLARSCCFLLWFNEDILEYLLGDVTEDEHDLTIANIIDLPIIEKLGDIYVCHSLTRKGMINKYSINNPDLVITTFTSLIPYFKQNWEDDEIAVALIHSLLITNEMSEVKTRIKKLLRRFEQRGIISKISGLLDAIKDTEDMPFVESLKKDSIYWFTLGYANQAKGDYHFAINNYTDAIKLEPKEASYYNNRGLVFAKVGSFDNSILDFTKAIELSSDMTEISQYINNRGLVFDSIGKIEEAKSDFSKASNLSTMLSKIGLSKVVFLDIPKPYEESKNYVQMLTIVLRASGDKTKDQIRMRRIYRIVFGYPGNDRFAFQVYEDKRGYRIEFPNLTTNVCPELIEKLAFLVGKENIKTEKILYY
jgi:tetratricopeptide (TPR) repeat protein